ncbi:MAG: thermonuclease family protein, partial [Candidatus Promineifilaceae bacterium]
MKHKLIALLLVLIILTIFASGCNIFTIGSSNEFSEELGVIPDGERAKVTWVYDGDTVEVELGGREYRVRYIGVDTPEIDQPYYEEASRANFDMVKNKDVILVRDVSDTDQYNRLLRYVYLADGTMVNAELLRDGYGRTINIPPDISQQAYFAQLQAEAKQEERGLWALEENKILPDGCVTCTKNAYDCKDFATQ